MPHPSFASFAKEGGDFDMPRPGTPHPQQSCEKYSWRLKNARVEISSMLARLPRDGFQRNSPKFTSGCPAFAPGAPFLARSLREKWGFSGGKLLADTEFRNDRLIPLGIVFLQVVEQATPLADQHEQAAA